MIFDFFVLGTFWFWAIIAIEFFLLIYFLESESYILAPLSFLGVSALLIFANSSLVSIFQWICDNPFYVVAGFFAYFLIGTVYVVSPYVGKWWWFVRDVREKNREYKLSWLGDYQKHINKLKDHLQTKERIVERDSNSTTSVTSERRNELILEVESIKKHLEAWMEYGNNPDSNVTKALAPYWKIYQEDNYFYDWFGRSISIEKPTPDNFKARIIAWIAYWPPSLFWTLLNNPLRRIGNMIYESVLNILKNISDSAWKDE
jgi:hypothetical protein